MEEALEHSTYMFMIATKQFCQDSWAGLQRDECLMESITNPDKRWSVASYYLCTGYPVLVSRISGRVLLSSSSSGQTVEWNRILQMQGVTNKEGCTGYPVLVGQISHRFYFSVPA